MAVEQATNAPIMHGIQPPTGLDLKSRNKAENWKAYKQRWENYIIVTQLDKQPEEYRVLPLEKFFIVRLLDPSWSMVQICGLLTRRNIEN